jgi:preprotein translocase subunit YajC
LFTTPALAQATGAAPGLSEITGMILPFAAIMVVFYFLLIRPQQRKMKDHQAMLSKISRGDTVITSGGLIGRVSKVVDDHELQVEVAEGVKLRILRSGISDVRAKGEPVKADAKSEAK